MPLIRKPTEIASSAPVASSSLASADPNERWIAARAARKPEDIPALAAALAAETDARVREALFTALARIATPDAARTALTHLRADDAGMRAGAVDALRAMPQAMQSFLPGLLADSDPDVRLIACELMRNTLWPDAARELCAMLGSEPQANVCAAAVDVLGEIADASAIPALESCARRFPDDPFLGFAVAVVLERLAPPSQAARD